MGLFDSFCSGVSSFFSGAVSFVSSGLSAAASWCGEKFTNIICSDGGLFGKIGGIAGGILQALGLWGEKETPEDVGDRALQAHEQGIFPEN